MAGRARQFTHRSARRVIESPWQRHGDDTRLRVGPGQENAPDANVASGGGCYEMTDDPLTAAQRRKLFALAGEHGLTLDGLRALTPAGSISMLNRGEAAVLINTLDGPPLEDSDTRMPPETADLDAMRDYG